MTITLTNEQARNFLLLKHGLLGDYKFIGKQGVLDFVHQAGCIQYDPIDVCGKNAELVLHSRVKGFQKEMLYDLLYKDRELLDYFDKNLAILSVSDWKHCARDRAQSQSGGRSFAAVNAVCDTIKSIIRDKGPVCSADLEFNEKVHWYWSNTKLSRAALETLYFRGDLVIHHKKGTVKYYDLAENCLPQRILLEPDPNEDEFSHLTWRVARRIASIGLLWNRASDAFLNISLKATQRNEAFVALQQEDVIAEVHVDGVKEPLYCSSSDAQLLQAVKQTDAYKKRCEFLAPLDNLLWDRKLIKALFGFDYKWEIYTPEKDRKYGYYVLPVLYGNAFMGRIEAVCDRNALCLNVKHIWLENGIKPTATLLKALDARIRTFAAFNGCQTVHRQDELTP